MLMLALSRSRERLRVIDFGGNLATNYYQNRKILGRLASRVARGEVLVIDVRNDSDWSAGHMAGAMHNHIGHLASRIKEIHRDRPIVLQFQGRGRSASVA